MRQGKRAWRIGAILVVGVAALLAQRALLERHFLTRMASDTLAPVLRGEGRGAFADCALVERLAPGACRPVRGEIIVIDTKRMGHPHVVSDYLFIKRVAALAGERVRLRPPDILVDGEPLREPEIFRRISGMAPGWHGYVFSPYAFPYRLALASEADEVAVPPGHVFVMGDNSRISLDSRHFGPVPVGAVTGRARWIVWPPWRVRRL